MSKRIRDISGKWLNTSVFTEAATRFLERGYYCEAPYGTPDWVSYWEEELRRCKEGFEVKGKGKEVIKITGHHYFYLNYAPILRLEQISEDIDEEDIVASKKISFPDFWDGDYNFFWALEIARNGICSNKSLVPSSSYERREWYSYNRTYKQLSKSDIPEDKSEAIKAKTKRDAISQKILDRLNLFVKPNLDFLNGGYHFVVGKARRRGYSYKVGAICANTYNTVRGSLTTIGAFEKKFVDQTMDKVNDYLNFIDEHTGWSKQRLLDKRDYKKSGYIENINGINIEKGYKSQIDASRTFKDNPDAMRGIDAFQIIFEEAGAFDNLALAYNATKPSLTAGTKMTGQIIIIGTSGDLKKGTVDYADMCLNPIAYELMPFKNIWEEGKEDTDVCFFHPCSWNLEGFYDKQGNSDIEGATKWELERRAKIIANSSSQTLLQQHIQEFPLCPSDAFNIASFNIFPTNELRTQLDKVIANHLQTKMGIPVYLERVEGKVIAKPDLENKLKPIYNYIPKVDDLKGCPIIYEYPIENTPRGLYKIGYDPYRQDKGTSLASIIVYKGQYKGSYNNNTIVAEYIGRPEEADDVNRIASMLADLYNCEIMHENEVTHVKNYFRRIKRLDQLAVQPDTVISKSIKNSSVSRVYGCHMTEQLKDAGEKYIKDWLLQIKDYDENGDPVYMLETIYSIGLLEELLRYNRKGNFDRISALIQVMFQVQEEDLGKDYNVETMDNTKAMVQLFEKFKRNSLYGRF